eukprot:sb/3463388/
MVNKILIGLLTGFLAVLVSQISWQYEYVGKTYITNITGSQINFTRAEGMYFKATGGNRDEDFFKAIGWIQAHDRYVQLCLIRLASQGLLTKYLPFSRASLDTDIKAQQMNVYGRSRANYGSIPKESLTVYQHYVDGINSWMANNPRPLEFVLLNYHPELFTPVDVMSMFKFVAYAGLNDIFLQVEKLGLEILRETDNRDLLSEVFAPHYNNLTDELVEIYRSISDFRPFADHDLSEVPKMINSNNWVVSGKRTESGKPLMASDPHMDVSRLPGFFHELHYTDGKGFDLFGIGITSIPTTMFGRTQDLTATLTFGMLDMSDYFVENITDGKYERDGVFLPLKERIVEIAGDTYYFYDTTEGNTIERNLEASRQPIRDGKFLATSFAMPLEGEIIMADVFRKLPTCKDVKEAGKLVARNLAGLNFLFADSQGNIAYQQSGFVPLRSSATGLIPLPAWDTANHWKGYLSGDDYMSIVNPEEGWLATANNLFQDPDKPISTTFSALNYRYDRVAQLLASKEKFTADDFKKFQSDTHSLRTDMVLGRIGHLLSDEGYQYSCLLSGMSFPLSSGQSPMWILV